MREEMKRDVGANRIAEEKGDAYNWLRPARRRTGLACN